VRIAQQWLVCCTMSDNASSATQINDDEDDRKRRSRRISTSPTNDNDGGDAPVAKKLRFSPHNFKHCTDIAKLPIGTHCSGCVACKDFGTKARQQHTTKKHNCFKAWTKNADKATPAMAAHVLAVQEHIENHLHIAVSSIQEGDVPSTLPTPATPAPMTAPVSPAEPTPTRNIDYKMNPVHSQGRCFEFNIPNSHTIAHKGHLAQLENEREMLNSMRSKFQQKQHTTHSTCTQTLWATALSSVPALAFSAIQLLLPLLVMAFLQDTGMFD